MNYKILIVDDEPSNLRSLNRLLSRVYTVHTAESGPAALELLRQHEFAAIISDHRMPGMTGIEFLKQAAQMRHQTVRLLLTGYTDVETLVDAINSGAIYQYLTKPWDNDDLLQTMRRALEHHESIKAIYRSKSDLERMRRREESLRSCLMRCWDEMIAQKGPELLAHAARTSGWARAIALTLGLGDAEAEAVATAARMLPFAYGPATVADVVSGGPVSDETAAHRLTELTHTLELLGDLVGLDEFREAAEAIAFSNEHFDGTGFPDRLGGDRIPLAARIVAVARAYDLVTSVGMHGRKLDHQQAISNLSSGTAERFDPDVIAALARFGLESDADGPFGTALGGMPPANPVLLGGV